MPTQRELLDLLSRESTETAPMHRNKIAEKFGETSYRSFQTPLDRLVKAGQLKVTQDHEYWITDAGKDELAGVSGVADELDEEKLGTTEYQQFVKLGKLHGVAPPDLIKITADHVWAGGDYKDLDWIAQGMEQMGVRRDLRNRWWHSWRVHLHQPIPTQIPAAIGEPVSEGAKVSKKEGEGGRDYILDVDGNPVKVGEGYGDLDYKDAVALSALKLGRGSKVAGQQAQTPASMADDMVKMFTVFQQFMGPRAEGKSWMVRQGEEGLQVEEVEPGRPMVVNYPQGNNKQTATYFVNSEGEVEQVQPGQPIVIRQPAPAQGGGAVQYLIDKTTGQVSQVEPGQPIVIHAQPPQQQYPYTPIEMKDKDGNPMVLDLETYIRLEEFKDKRQRDQEEHELQVDIMKGLKDVATKATAAFGRMAERK